MSKKEITFKLLECDSPSPYTGRIYPKDVVEKMVVDYQEKIEKGLAVGVIGDIKTIAIDPLDISHIVTEMKIDNDGNVITKIKILDTEQGRILSDIIDCGIRLSPISIGKLNEDKVITESTFITTSILHENE